MILLSVWIANSPAGASDLPPAGASSFDLLVGEGPVPYPLSALMARIRAQLDASNDGFSPLKTTLIPLGRSLQRAAAPDFFRFPRVVAAVDGTSRAGYAPLQDRLFFGYNERAGVLEVISYNEAAGRFEFQVVRDYRAGAQPRLYYARRALCLACHQNAAPIFARPLWDETPANPAIAARLKVTGRDYYGIALSGTDVAYLIDAAVERAGLFPLWQQVWREACDAECRTQWLDAALRYALSGSLPDASLLQLTALEARWDSVWPQGLPIPNASIPNRDPLQPVVETATAPADAPPTAAAELAQLAPVPVRFEPLNPRPPREHWAQPDNARLVAGLAGLLSSSDVAALDRALTQDTNAPAQNYELPCRFTAKPARLVFECAGSAIEVAGVIDAPGDSGRVDRLRVDQVSAATGLTLSGRPTAAGVFDFTPARHAASARLPDGRRWARLRLRGRIADWPRRPTTIPTDVLRTDGSAQITLIADYAVARAAVARLPVLTAEIFDGSRALAELRQQLGFAALRTRSVRSPPAQLEPVAEPELAGRAAQFHRHCGECHNSNGNVPPNFLHGDAATVEARLDHCAERIFYRLSQWRLNASQRRKTPMPPVSALAAQGSDAAIWAASATLAHLVDDAGQRLRAQGKEVDSVLAIPFDTLRPCLPAPAAGRAVAPSLTPIPTAH
ncbi:MAG: hypothetical protein ACSLE5_04570 [Porticoccaceae bacterium]